MDDILDTSAQPPTRLAGDDSITNRRPARGGFLHLTNASIDAEMSKFKSLVALKVYLILRSWQQGTIAWRSIEDLADDTGHSRGGISRALDELVAMGAISLHANGRRGRSAEYQIHTDWASFAKCRSVAPAQPINGEKVARAQPNEAECVAPAHQWVAPAHKRVAPAHESIAPAQPSITKQLSSQVTKQKRCGPPTVVDRESLDSASASPNPSLFGESKPEPATPANDQKTTGDYQKFIDHFVELSRLELGDCNKLSKRDATHLAAVWSSCRKDLALAVAVIDAYFAETHKFFAGHCPSKLASNVRQFIVTARQKTGRNCNGSDHVTVRNKEGIDRLEPRDPLAGIRRINFGSDPSAA